MRSCFLCICVVLSIGCHRNDVQLFDEKRILMDTLVSITIYAAEEPPDWHKHVDDAFGAIDEIDKLTSSYNDTSEVGQLNLKAGLDSVHVSPETLEIIQQAVKVSELSDGAFDVTVWPLKKLWGFGFENPHIPDDKLIAEKKNLVDYRNILIEAANIYLIKKGMGVDLGGIAKGYAVDHAVDILNKYNYKDFLVEAGGDLRAVAGELSRGHRKIWIRHPRNRKQFFGYIELDEGAVATSGDYERFFEENGQRYHHILNPVTGYPSRPCVSVTIVAASTALADAYSTAVFVLGPDAGLHLIENTPEIEGLIIYQEDPETSSKLSWKASKQISERLTVLDD